MAKFPLSRLANALYHVRCALGIKKPGRGELGLIRMHLEYAESACKDLFEHVGVEVGSKAEDADHLKMTLQDIEIGKPGVPVHRRVDPNLSPVEGALDRAARESGSDDEFRELGRFQIFCMRARFPGMVEEDPDLPVRAWIEARDHVSLVDIREAADLFVQWQREANNRVFPRGASLDDVLDQIANHK